MGWNPFARKARDLAREIESADQSDVQREFSGITIALWALKIFLYLLAKWPQLHQVSLRQYSRFAIEHEADEDRRNEICRAVSLLQSVTRQTPKTFEQVARKEAASL